MEKDYNQQIAQYVKSYLDENQISLRTFSKQANIPASTLSRILSLKQKANIEHVKKIAEVLHVNPANLILENEPIKALSHNNLEAFIENNIDTLLAFSKLESCETIESSMQKQFADCQKYAATSEGVSVIKKEFEEKISSINEGGPFVDTIRSFYRRYLSSSPLSKIALLLGGVLLYFIIPVDAIPDFLFGVGYLDDIMVTNSAMTTLTQA